MVEGGDRKYIEEEDVSNIYRVGLYNLIFLDLLFRVGPTRFGPGSIPGRP